MNILKKSIEYWRRRRTAKKIESGKLPRGRTLVEEGSEMDQAGKFGGGLLNAHTELVAKHYVLDENGERVFEDGERYSEVIEDRRVVRDRVVTDAFVNFIVAQLQTETSAFGDFKYHDSGTGTNAEAAGDTALQTPTGEARSVGTQVEGGTTNQYKSVATDTYAGSFAITEHGLFNASSAGTLMDRTKFSAINVGSGDKIEFTFTIDFTAGG